MKSPIGMMFHPRLDVIEAFANGALGEDERQRVAAHLRECAKCQDEVRFARDLTQLAQSDADMPPMSADLRARVLDQAKAGETRLLSADVVSESPSRRSHTIRNWGLAAAAAVIISALVFPRNGLKASSTAGTLEISQKLESAAPAIDVRYVAPSSIPSSGVTLRVLTYDKKNPFKPEQHDYSLDRKSDATYTARIALPAEAVFARYTVVHSKGVDDNDGRGWESVVTAPGGQPLFDGLWVQRAVNDRDNWERASAAAKAMVKYYPDNPVGLRYAMYDAMELSGAAGADSVRNANRSRVLALHRKLATAPLDANTMWEFAMLGAEIRDTAVTSHWRNRMMREYPRDAGTIQQRVFAIGEQRLPATRRLEAFEELFDETGGQAIQLLADGFDLALETTDNALIERWGDRVARFGAGFEGRVAVEYAALPTFRARGEEMLRKSLRSLPPVQSVDWRSTLRNPALRTPLSGGQWQLQALGIALLADGRVDAARDTLRRALTFGWNVETLRALGEAELLAHDTAAARATWAWLVADTRTKAAVADSLRAQLGTAARGAAWDAEVKEGKTVLASLVLKDAVRRAFDNANASFADVSGKRRRLGDAVSSPISVIAFVSRHCAPSVHDLSSLSAVAGRLRASGVPVTVLVEESESPAVIVALSSQGYTGGVGFDDRAEVSRRVRQSGTPHYLVVENGNVIRFNARRAEDLVAQVEALRTAR